MNEEEILSLRSVFETNPNLFSPQDYNPLAGLYEGVDQPPSLLALRQAQEEARSDDFSFGGLLSQFGLGFIQGFTTLPAGDEPANIAEAISRNIGNVLGFLGIFPGVGTVAKVGFNGLTRGVLAAGKAFGATGRAAKILGATGRAGASLISKGEMFGKPYTRVTSVPFLVAEKAYGALGKRLSPDTVKFLSETKAGTALREGFIGGIASGVSTLPYGFSEAGEAGLLGATENAVFRTISNAIPGKGGTAIALRAVTNAAYSGAYSGLRDDPLPITVYHTLLGGLLGADDLPFNEIRANGYMARKMQGTSHMFRGTAIAQAMKDPEFADLPTDVQDIVKEQFDLTLAANINYVDKEGAEQTVGLGEAISLISAAEAAGDSKYFRNLAVDAATRKDAESANAYAEMAFIKRVQEGIEEDTANIEAEAIAEAQQSRSAEAEREALESFGVGAKAKEPAADPNAREINEQAAYEALDDFGKTKFLIDSILEGTRSDVVENASIRQTLEDHDVPLTLQKPLQRIANFVGPEDLALVGGKIRQFAGEIKEGTRKFNDIELTKFFDDLSLYPADAEIKKGATEAETRRFVQTRNRYSALKDYIDTHSGKSDIVQALLREISPTKTAKKKLVYVRLDDEGETKITLHTAGSKGDDFENILPNGDKISEDYDTTLLDQVLESTGLEVRYLDIALFGQKGRNRTTWSKGGVADYFTGTESVFTGEKPEVIKIDTEANILVRELEKDGWIPFQFRKDSGQLIVTNGYAWEGLGVKQDEVSPLLREVYSRLKASGVSESQIRDLLSTATRFTPRGVSPNFRKNALLHNMIMLGRIYDQPTLTADPYDIAASMKRMFFGGGKLFKNAADLNKRMQGITDGNMPVPASFFDNIAIQPITAKKRFGDLAYTGGSKRRGREGLRLNVEGIGPVQVSGYGYDFGELGRFFISKAKGGWQAYKLGDPVDVERIAGTAVVGGEQIRYDYMPSKGEIPTAVPVGDAFSKIDDAINNILQDTEREVAPFVRRAQVPTYGRVGGVRTMYVEADLDMDGYVPYKYADGKPVEEVYDGFVYLHNNLYDKFAELMGQSGRESGLKLSTVHNNGVDGLDFNKAFFLRASDDLSEQMEKMGRGGIGMMVMPTSSKVRGTRKLYKRKVSTDEKGLIKSIDFLDDKGAVVTSPETYVTPFSAFRMNPGASQHKSLAITSKFVDGVRKATRKNHIPLQLITTIRDDDDAISYVMDSYIIENLEGNAEAYNRYLNGDLSDFDIDNIPLQSLVEDVLGKNPSNLEIYQHAMHQIIFGRPPKEGDKIVAADEEIGQDDDGLSSVDNMSFAIDMAGARGQLEAILDKPYAISPTLVTSFGNYIDKSIINYVNRRVTRPRFDYGGQSQMYPLQSEVAISNVLRLSKSLPTDKMYDGALSKTMAKGQIPRGYVLLDAGMRDVIIPFMGKDTKLGDAWDAYIKAVQKEEPRAELPAGLTKKEAFTVKPIRSVDKKAITKASVSTQFIGFGEGIKGSSTELYRQQAGDLANTGSYSADDVIFVSVPGKRGDPAISKKQQDKTIREAIKAIEAGATLITDNKAYIDSNAYNTGEKRLYLNLEAKGYSYSESTVDGQLLGIWNKSPELRAASNQAMSYKMPAKENLTGKDTSTLELVEQGLRTATTRSFPLGKVGDIITFEGRPQKYRITGVEQLTKEKVEDPDWIKKWSEKEQWTEDHFKKVLGGKTVHIGSYQTTFEKVAAPLVKKVDTPSIKTQMEEALEALYIRVPMATQEGARNLKLAGFTNQRGYGVYMHGFDMNKLGGADLDGDKAFFIFDMDKNGGKSGPVRNHYRKFADTGVLKKSADPLVSDVPTPVKDPALNDLFDIRGEERFDSKFSVLNPLTNVFSGISARHGNQGIGVHALFPRRAQELIDVVREKIAEAKVPASQPSSSVKVTAVSPAYGVAVAETNPNQTKTQEFVNIIQPQIRAQAYKENASGTANDMFNYGFRWTRRSKAKAPLNNKSYANKGLPITDAKAKDGYVYDTVDQNGNPLAPVSDLQPIIAEIENALGIDMSNYDAVIGNIYLPGQNVATHRDTTESLSARNYPVVVYTIGNNSGIGIYENEKSPGSISFGSDKKRLIPTKNGTIYTFGMDGKGRFELAHDTPKDVKRGKKFPPITLPNGAVVKNYTITLTFRRAADLEPGMPTAPAKLTTQPATQKQAVVKKGSDIAKTEAKYVHIDGNTRVNMFGKPYVIRSWFTVDGFEDRVREAYRINNDLLQRSADSADVPMANGIQDRTEFVMSILVDRGIEEVKPNAKAVGPPSNPKSPVPFLVGVMENAISLDSGKRGAENLYDYLSSISRFSGTNYKKSNIYYRSLSTFGKSFDLNKIAPTRSRQLSDPKLRENNPNPNNLRPSFMPHEGIIRMAEKIRDESSKKGSPIQTFVGGGRAAFGASSNYKTRWQANGDIEASTISTALAETGKRALNQIKDKLSLGDKEALDAMQKYNERIFEIKNVLNEATNKGDVEGIETAYTRLNNIFEKLSGVGRDVRNHYMMLLYSPINGLKQTKTGPILDTNLRQSIRRYSGITPDDVRMYFELIASVETGFSGKTTILRPTEAEKAKPKKPAAAEPVPKRMTRPNLMGDSPSTSVDSDTVSDPATQAAKAAGFEVDAESERAYRVNGLDERKRMLAHLDNIEAIKTAVDESGVFDPSKKSGREAQKLRDRMVAVFNRNPQLLEHFNEVFAYATGEASLLGPYTALSAADRDSIDRFLTFFEKPFDRGILQNLVNRAAAGEDGLLSKWLPYFFPDSIANAMRANDLIIGNDKVRKLVFTKEGVKNLPVRPVYSAGDEMVNTFKLANEAESENFSVFDRLINDLAADISDQGKNQDGDTMFKIAVGIREMNSYLRDDKTSGLTLTKEQLIDAIESDKGAINIVNRNVEVPEEILRFRKLYKDYKRILESGQSYSFKMGGLGNKFVKLSAEEMMGTIGERDKPGAINKRITDIYKLVYEDYIGDYTEGNIPSRDAKFMVMNSVGEIDYAASLDKLRKYMAQEGKLPNMTYNGVQRLLYEQQIQFYHQNRIQVDRLTEQQEQYIENHPSLSVEKSSAGIIVTGSSRDIRDAGLLNKTVRLFRTIVNKKNVLITNEGGETIPAVEKSKRYVLEPVNGFDELNRFIREDVGDFEYQGNNPFENVVFKKNPNRRVNLGADDEPHEINILHVDDVLNVYSQRRYKTRYNPVGNIDGDVYWARMNHDPVEIDAFVRGLPKPTNPADERRMALFLKNLIMQSKISSEMLSQDLQALVNSYEPSRDLTDPVFTEAIVRMPSNLKARGFIPFPGWSADINVLTDYSRSMVEAQAKAVSILLGQDTVKRFESRAVTENQIRPDLIVEWKDYLRTYLQSYLGISSLTTEGVVSSDGKKGRTVGFFTSDEAVFDKWRSFDKKFFGGKYVQKQIDRDVANGMSKEEAERVARQRASNWLRSFSRAEAKYQLATLLANTRSLTNNLVGGSAMTMASVGFRNFIRASRSDYMAGISPNLATTADRIREAERYGVIETFIQKEANLTPVFQTVVGRAALKDVLKLIKQNPLAKDSEIRTILRNRGLQDKLLSTAGWFMQFSERQVRTNAFWAHYLKAREVYNIDRTTKYNDPRLIELAKKGSDASQFLYNSASRPIASATPVGKIFSRFQLYSWNSVRFRRDVYNQAKALGFRQGTPEFERLRTTLTADLMVLGLASTLPYSTFQAVAPVGFGALTSLSEYLFGDEEEREKAFFGILPYPANIIGLAAPPGLRILTTPIKGGMALFDLMLLNSSEDFELFLQNDLMSLIPFGSMVKNLYRAKESPQMSVEFLTGLPYMALSRTMNRLSSVDELYQMPFGSSRLAVPAMSDKEKRARRREIKEEREDAMLDTDSGTVVLGNSDEELNNAIRSMVMEFNEALQLQ